MEEASKNLMEFNGASIVSVRQKRIPLGEHCPMENDY